LGVSTAAQDRDSVPLIMPTQIRIDEVLIRLHAIKDSGKPILFHLSSRGWPQVHAGGHGLIVEVSKESINVLGEAGSLHVPLDDKTEYRLSGHYQLAEVQKSHLPTDLYFRRLNQVRAIIFIAETWEAHLIFELGADR
jgi:hypothetical protein